MNVIDASIKLYEWFGKTDSFSMEEDYCRISTITDTPERDRAAFTCALKNLEKYELIQSAEVPSLDENKEYKTIKVWVLSKPLESVTQTVEIDYALAGLISNLINDFTRIVDKRESYSDPNNITQETVRDLAFMVGFLLNTPTEEEKSE